jgi:hypothetical protein
MSFPIFYAPFSSYLLFPFSSCLNSICQSLYVYCTFEAEGFKDCCQEYYTLLSYKLTERLRKGCWYVFGFSYFTYGWFAAQPKSFFLDGLKKLEQRNHKCVELRGEYVEWIYFFSPVACCFLYKAKDLSAPSYIYGSKTAVRGFVTAHTKALSNFHPSAILRIHFPK